MFIYRQPPMSHVTRNIGGVVLEKMSAPELQIYQARQVYEASLTCLDLPTLHQKPLVWIKGEIYNRYPRCP